MRRFLFFFVAMAFAGPQAFADAKSYCELSAKDFASAQTSDVDQWQKKYRSTYDDCMLQYSVAEPEPVPAVLPQKKSVVAIKAPEEKAPAKVSVKPALKKMEQGSNEWNAYCEAKYTSFDKAKGTYLSRTGVVRRCLVTP
jgi:hypothetical protein